MSFRLVCPKDLSHEEFSVTAHVAQEWKVGRGGDFIETLDQCSEILNRPNTQDYVYSCIVCGSEAEPLVGDGKDVAGVDIEFLYTWPFSQLKPVPGMDVPSFLQDFESAAEGLLKVWYPKAEVKVIASTSGDIEIVGPNDVQEVGLAQRILREALSLMEVKNYVREKKSG
jgi:hypothetical protein